MALWALVRVVSMGYLLGLATLSLAALLWHLLRPRLAPHVRADASMWILAGAFALNSALAVVIYLGVINDKILMTTNYFHQLMFGGWGLMIVITGGLTFIASLILAWLNWRKGRVPAASGNGEGDLHHKAQKLRPNSLIPTISLVGAWRPEVWVNPAYWAGLSDEQRELALAHEYMHKSRRDNPRRLAVMYIAGLYAVLPWVRSWVKDFELDTELAVDDACRQRYPGGQYAALIAHATEYVLRWDQPVVASHLSSSEHAVRLRTLSHPRREQPPLLARIAGLAVAAFSILPAAALLFHPVSRCLCACYLGY
jgi:beta-lactamase regulating signal transducer with metallopeptidase domain